MELHDYAVPFQAPDDFVIPPELQDRFRYEPDRKRLVYRGLMYKATFDRLVQLHRDSRYQIALEELFRRSGSATAAPSGGRRGLGWLALAVVLLLAGCVVLCWK